MDVDKNKGIDGYEVLRDWQNKHGELPETWQSITGRGGYHYFYKDTITHSNKVGLYEGVDILLFVIVCELAAIYDRQNGGK